MCVSTRAGVLVEYPRARRGKMEGYEGAGASRGRAGTTEASPHPAPSPLTTNQPAFFTPLITKPGSRTAAPHMLRRLASYY